MGRPLFSEKYSTPAIQEDPHPSADALDVPCEKWSTWNQFDPDSEEFFTDALVEHFIDAPINSPIELDNVDEPPHVIVLESVAENNSARSPASSNSHDNNDNRDIDFLSDTSDSPMAVGADDPASLLAGVYTPVDWQQRFLEFGSDPRYQGRTSRVIYRGPRRTGMPRQYPGAGDPNSPTGRSPVSVVVPPVSYRNTTTNPASVQEPVPRSPVSRRTVTITPINIPREPSLPSPVSPSTPSTSAPNVVYPATPNTFTTSPSPAPNVTPRIYTWNRAAVPSSPTRDSPLTNPRARLSLSRIDTMSMAMVQHQYNTPVPVLDRRH